MPKVRIYTDGSCSQVASSTGPGGYAAILLFEDNTIELLGSEPVTTNNRMELFGAIAAIESLKESYEITLYSDSAYVVECFRQKWFERWIRNGWINSSGKPVVNKDLWVRLMRSLKGHKIEFVKVKGHANDELNNRCDELARNAMELQC